ncbi:MAG: glycosyltransferase [Acidimicrobiia bacterium]
MSAPRAVSAAFRPDRRPFLLASAGGHVRELTELVRQLGLRPGNATWGSSKGKQLDSLAADGWDVVEVPLCEPRDTAALLKAFRPAHHILGDVRPSGVLTTGSAVALPFAAASRLRRIPFTFVESLTRVSGPSRTGTFIELLPGIDLRTQVIPWERRRGPLTRRWRRTISALDGFERIATTTSMPVRRVFVAVGIMTREYPFDRLFDRLEAIVPDGVEVRVQGSRPRTTDRLTLLPDLTPAGVQAEIEAADAVIVHAGVGLTLDCFEAGRHPLVVAREGAHGEHVDDHQLEFADALRRQDLATTAHVDDLTWSVVEEAVGWSVRRAAPKLDPERLGLAGLPDAVVRELNDRRS